MPEQKIFHKIIRVPKEQSAFTYFTFESNEGLCFYSTLESGLGQGHRDIDIMGDLALHEEFMAMLKSLQNEFPIDIILEEILVSELGGKSWAI